MPMAPTKGGRIIGTSTTEARAALPGNSKRSLMKASGTAMAKAMAVVASPSQNELSRPSR